MYEQINKLKELSYNLYWSWTPEVTAIFEEIDKFKWEWTNHNPVKFLRYFEAEYLIYLIKKKNLTDKINSAHNNFREYLSHSTYYKNNISSSEEPFVAYFSAEYGLTECLKTYSGGLGVLSGDHLKSSSDLGIPLVAVGLAYSNGYFNQLINEEGKQYEKVDKNNFKSLPMFRVSDEFNNPFFVEIEFPGRIVYCSVLAVNIGRVKLYLLDTNNELNNEHDKHITDTLYGGDNEKRIQQEIVLGIGGIRLLNMLQYNIKKFHINEGHSAFLTIERIKSLMQHSGMNFTDAKAASFKGNLFTTHTPVPAGFDIFTKDLMLKYFGSYVQSYLQIPFQDFMKEGRLNDNSLDAFNMAHLAINNSEDINAVSRLHGEVSKKMWSVSAPDKDIKYITNGIHTLSYLAPSFRELYEQAFGSKWYRDEEVWNNICKIPPSLLWQLRSFNRRKLVEFARERTISSRFYSSVYNGNLEQLLDTNALTIGFARRFATYKRGNLIFKDKDRLLSILNNSKMPVQFIFSGKAHPKDEAGKNFISEIVSFTGMDEFKFKVIFLENYNIEVAKMLVQGCDVWLNNPIRPLEASGTSGMKIIANGGLNLSILDGWWDEGYSPDNGWKIDSLPENSPAEERDIFEVASLYDTLENKVIPCFYNRDENGVPQDWIQMIKNSIKKLAPDFTTGRMVKEYLHKFYLNN